MPTKEKTFLQILLESENNVSHNIKTDYINEATLKKIVNKSKIAQRVLKKLGICGRFFEFFHLRPTSTGITIVSTLPFAPMRGLNATSEDDLLDKLKKIMKRFNVICCSSDYKKALEELKKIGFKSRATIDYASEESMQAYFINGMVRKETSYNGIEFIASEFMLKSDRFDVVGLKNDCLYIFELKKYSSSTNKINNVSKQIKKYINLVKNNKTEFDKVLSSYPSFSSVSFNKVKGVIILKDTPQSCCTCKANNASMNGCSVLGLNNNGKGCSINLENECIRNDEEIEIWHVGVGISSTRK